MWSSPPTTGSRPPPCSNFTFTAIDAHRGVLFGGYSPEHGKMNDVYIINVQTMVCLCVCGHMHVYCTFIVMIVVGTILVYRSAQVLGQYAFMLILLAGEI